MVKKIFYPLFAAAILLFAESALAEQIDAQQARQQAMAFLNRNATTKKMLKGGNADLQLAYTAQSGEYYAFNASAADGYVLVSGDDRMPAVIGYSDEGKFDADAIPDNMREWLETYAEQVRDNLQAQSKVVEGNIQSLKQFETEYRARLTEYLGQLASQVSESNNYVDQTSSKTN